MISTVTLAPLSLPLVGNAVKATVQLLNRAVCSVMLKSFGKFSRCVQRKQTQRLNMSAIHDTISA